MNKCRYCEYTYTNDDEMLIHLNATHTKCPCGTVWNNGDFGDDYHYTLCKVCYELEEEEEEEDEQ